MPQQRCVLAAPVHVGRACAMCHFFLLTGACGWCVLARVRFYPLRISMRHGALSATKQVRRRGCCTWLVPLHSLTPPVWCGFAVPITRSPVRMFCNAPCHVQSLLVAMLAVLGPRAGARACDMQGPQHMTEQRTEQGPAQIAVLKLLLVCPVTPVPSTRALRSPAVQTVAASPGPTVVLAGQTLPPSLAGSLPFMA